MLIGSAADIGGTIIAGIFLSIIAGITMHEPTETPQQLQARLLTNAGFLIATLVVGLAFSGVGGFVAASLAKQRELLHAAMTGAICVVFSLLTSLSAAQALPLWYRLAGEALVLPVALAGGLAARAINRRAARGLTSA